MSVTIQCVIKSISDKLNEIEQMLGVIHKFDIEQDALQKLNEGEKK